MLETLGATGLVALIGFGGGVLLGLAARIGRFCTLGAIEDVLYGHNWERMAMWGVAIGGAIIGTFSLVAMGLLSPEQSIYLGQQWTPMASVLGGLLFGYGMALAGNCGFGALARLGGGELRAFVVVLIMGLASFMTISGPLAYVRVWLFPVSPSEGALPGIAHLLADLGGMSVSGVGLGIGTLVLVVAASRLRNRPAGILWGMVVATAIVSAWAGTQWVAIEGFDETPVVSHTFSAPPGEVMLWLMTASGTTLTFGIGSVAGVLVGAFAGSLAKGQCRGEAGDDPRERKRQILGAALMGVGAVVAIGCTVGQGISAFSLLAFSAPVTFLAIFAGAALGLRQLITGFARTT